MQDENSTTKNRDQESRDATLARIITEAVAQQTKSIVEAVSKQKAEETQSLTDAFQRQMEETPAQYEELLKASRTQDFTSTLKVTSSTDGFRVMDPFDWTADKNIYQRWQLWSHKARLALDAIEGDNEKTKISYLHHWLDGKGIDKIKGWMNSKILKLPYHSGSSMFLIPSWKHLSAGFSQHLYQSREVPSCWKFPSSVSGSFPCVFSLACSQLLGV